VLLGLLHVVLREVHEVHQQACLYHHRYYCCFDCYIDDTCIDPSSNVIVTSYLRSDICILVLSCCPESVLPVVEKLPACVGS
jgi:hypothetical protein